MAKRKLLILFALVILFSGCNSFEYLFKAARYELLILTKEEKIENILKSQKIPLQLKEKLQLVLKVREFGREKYGLTPGKSYLYYAPVKIESAAYVLTAVKSTSWEIKTWWFPIVGRVPYLGFPSLKDAEEYARNLSKKGYDTSVREATAFSTLGYLPDPVTPLMLEYSPPILAEIILHEMTHATLYFAGHTMFDEHIAVLVENLAGLEFAKEKWGENSSEFTILKNKWMDTLLFSRFLSKAKKKLDSVYSSPIPKMDKLKKRASLLARMQSEFKKIPWKSNLFERFKLIPPNNAKFLQEWIYYGKIKILYNDFISGRKNLKGFLKFLGKKPSSIDPWNWAKEWAKNFPG